MLFLHFIFVLILLETNNHFESENGKTPEAGPCPWCTERDQSHQLPLIQSVGFLRGSLPCTVFCTCLCLLLLSILQLLKTVNQQRPLSSRHMGAFQQNLCKSHCEMKDASHREVPCLSEPSMYAEDSWSIPEHREAVSPHQDQLSVYWYFHLFLGRGMSHGVLGCFYFKLLTFSFFLHKLLILYDLLAFVFFKNYFKRS